MEDRVRLEMEREGIARAEALHVLRKDDVERRKWSQHLYGVDTADPSLYDLVIHIHKMKVKDAVDIISHTVGLEHFKTTPESKKVIDNLILSTEVEVALMDIHHDLRVSAQDGMVSVKAEATILQQDALIQEIEKIAKKIPGVNALKTDVLPIEPYSE